MNGFLLSLKRNLKIRFEFALARGLVVINWSLENSSFSDSALMLLLTDYPQEWTTTWIDAQISEEFDIIDFYDIIVYLFDIIVYHMQYHMYDIMDMILHMIT
jgi:hypothetical protein